MNTLKICYNCKHHGSIGFVSSNYYRDVCKRNVIETDEINLVTGEINKHGKGKYLLCEDERAGTRHIHCGKSGFYYEPL